MNEFLDPTPEFSRLVAVDGLGKTPVVKQIAANEEERAALVRRFGLLALDSLSADLSVERLPGKGGIRVRGRFTVDVTQACVVSLEPVPAHLSEEFSQLYVLASETLPQREQIVDAEAEDPPEPIGARGLDLGEAVVQQIALVLDPYPRASDGRSPAGSEEAHEDAHEEGGKAEGPFAALKTLKGGG